MMLVSQSTNTKGLISAILGNAEIASLGRAPGHRAAMKIREMADAREWFLNMDEREWGDIDKDGNFVGFGAGYCINWCRNNRDSYMSELVGEWKRVDEKIAEEIKRVKFNFYSYHKTNKFNRRAKNLRSVPDPYALVICKNATEVMNKCREKYYG